MLPKAYRWIAEMHEISSFVGGPLGQVYSGMASVYERVERAVVDDTEDKHVLDDFARGAEQLLNRDYPHN